MGDSHKVSYSDALKNVQDTIATADSLRGLFSQIRSDVKEYLEWKNRLDGLLKDLGDWAPMVYRPGGQWWLPVLRTGPFEEYLSSRDGILSPAPDCQARVGWAKLLHALGLRPTDTNTLDWKSTRNTSFDPTAPDAIRLETEGRVLCHIINLFKLYGADTNIAQPADKMPTTFKLQFGHLTISEPSTTSGTRSVTFEEISHRALGTPTTPFKVATSLGIPKSYGKFDDGTAYALYEQALGYGISATQAALSVGVDHHKRPRKDRAADLIKSIKLITQMERDPVLITTRWINDVSRIWRRVTLDPSSQKKDNKPDTRLVDFLIEKVSSTEILTTIKRATGANDEDIIDEATSAIKRCCMVHGGFVVHWTTRFKSKTHLENVLPVILKGGLPTLLANLQGAWEGSWNRELGEMVNEGSLEELLKLPRRLVNQNILIMGFAEGHQFWDNNQHCYVGEK